MSSVHPVPEGQIWEFLDRTLEQASCFFQDVVWIRRLWNNVLDNLCWIASNDNERRNILRDHATGAYRYSSTNCNPRKDSNAAPKPAVFAHGDGFAELRTLYAVAKEWVDWMCCTVEATIGTDECPRSYRYKACIKECTVEVDVYAGTKPGNMSMVALFYERIVT